MIACDCRTYRVEGTCYHTGKQPRALPAEAYRVERDRRFEGAFLTAAGELARKLGVADGEVFERYVFQRTDSTGAQNYGDTSFLTDARDLLMEARDEAADGAVYPMFHAERRRYDPGHDVRHHLEAAAAHFAAADWHLRSAIIVEHEMGLR